MLTYSPLMARVRSGGVDETAIQIDDSAIGYMSLSILLSVVLHIKLGTIQNLGLSEVLFWEFRANHDIEDTVILIDGIE